MPATRIPNLSLPRRGDDCEKKVREDQKVVNVRRQKNRSEASEELQAAMAAAIGTDEDVDRLKRASARAATYSVRGLKQALALIAEMGADMDDDYSDVPPRTPVKQSKRPLTISTCFAEQRLVVGSQNEELQFIRMVNSALPIGRMQPMLVDLENMREIRDVLVAKGLLRHTILITLIKIPQARGFFIHSLQNGHPTHVALKYMLTKWLKLPEEERRKMNSELGKRGHGPVYMCTTMGVSHQGAAPKNNPTIARMTSECIAEFMGKWMAVAEWDQGAVNAAALELNALFDKEKTPQVPAGKYNRQWCTRAALFFLGAQQRFDGMGSWSDLVGPLVDQHVQEQYQTPGAAAEDLHYNGPPLLFQANLCLVQKMFKVLSIRVGSGKAAVAWLRVNLPAVASRGEANPAAALMAVWQAAKRSKP
jgi:hypothetical protein